MRAYRRSDGAVVLMLSEIDPQAVKSGGAIDLELAYCGAWTKDGVDFELTPDVMDELVSSVSGVRSDIPTDYEHLMFKESSTPEQRKASGWLDPKTLRREGDGDGATLRTKWKPTQAARGYIQADEYRYPSIAFLPRTDKAPAKFLNFTLTTQPFLDGVPAITCSKETVNTMANPQDKAAVCAQDTEIKDPAMCADAPAPDAAPAAEEPASAVEDVAEDASESAEMAAVLDVYAKGLGLDMAGVLAWLKDNAEKLIAEGQRNVSASAAPSDKPADAPASEPAKDVEKEPVQASAAPAAVTASRDDSRVRELEAALAKKDREIIALNGRLTHAHSALAAHEPTEDDKAAAEAAKKAEAVALFTRELDDAIKLCKVHATERDNAIAFFSDDPDKARAVYLSRSYTVVPTAKLAPEPAPSASAQAVRDPAGRVIVELNRLNEVSKAAFNSLVSNRLMSREAAFEHLLAKQAEAAA